MDLTPRTMQITVRVDAAAGVQSMAEVDQAEKRVTESAAQADAALRKLTTGLAGIPSQKTTTDMLGLAKAFREAELGNKGLLDVAQRFAGIDVVGKANAYANAVTQVGGVTKLTTAEQKELLGVLTAAGQKYETLGRQVPADLRMLQQETTAALHATEGLGAGLSKTGSFMGDLGTQIKATILGFVSAQAIIATITGLFHGMVSFVRDSVQAYSEQESATKRMTTALQAQGRATPEIIQSYAAMATQFQKTTVNSDELINEMQALLVEVGDVGPDKMQRALTAATDLAAGLGVDLRTATMLVGKAFEGHTETLARYGIVIDQTRLKTEGVTAVLDAIQARFGGQAQAEVDTYAGKVKQLGNAWNELEETVGEIAITNPILEASLRHVKDGLTGASGAVVDHQHSWSDLLGQLNILPHEIPEAVRWIEGLAAASNAAARATDQAAAAFARAMAAFASMPSKSPAHFGTDLVDPSAVLKAWEDADKKATSAAEAHEKAVRSLMDAYSGSTAIKAAADAVEAVTRNEKAGIAVQQMTREQQDKINAVMKSALDAYAALGKTAPKAVTDIYTATFNLGKFLDQYGPKLSAFPDGLRGIGEAAKITVPPLTQLSDVVGGKLTDQFQKFFDKRYDEQYKRLAGQAHDGVSQILKDLRTWEETLRDLERASRVFGDAFAEIADNTSGLTSRIAAQLAIVTQAFEESAAAARRFFEAKENGDKAGQIGALAQGGAAFVGASNPEGKSGAATIAGGTLSGAMLGLQIGSFFGPGGAVAGFVIGAAAGFVVSLVRVIKSQSWKQIGEDIGVNMGIAISDKLAKQIDELRKTIEGGTGDQRRRWAELISLPDIISEQGGLNAGNAQMFERQSAGLFEIIQRGGATARPAFETLNKLVGQFAAYADSAGGMWDKTFKGLIQQSKDLGVNMENVTKAIEAQVSKLATGVATTIAGAFSGTDKAYAALTKGLSAEQLASLTHPEQRQAAGLDPATATAFAGVAEQAQPAFERLTRIALASLNTIVASGQTAAAALRGDLGAAVDILIAQHDKLGLTGGAAYDQLARLRGLVKAYGPLIDAAGSLNDVLVATSNLGGLNVDVLADLEAQGLSTFDQLQAAGFTETEALRQMVPFIENVIKAHVDLGVPIDENTQKMIDQAREQGLLSAEAMSTNDILMAGFAALIKAVGGELPAAFQTMAKSAQTESGKVTDAINKIPTGKQIDINVAYRTTGEPPDYNPSGGRPPGYETDPGNPQYFADGGVVIAAGGPKGPDTVQVWATPGELLLNASQQARLAAALATGGADMAEIVQQTTALAMAVGRLGSQMDAAGKADFSGAFKDDTKAAQQSIDDIDWAAFISQGKDASRVTGDVSTKAATIDAGLSGIPRTLGEATTAAGTFAGSFGGAFGSVDTLRGSVRDLGGDATTAAGIVAGTAGAMSQPYADATGVAEGLRLKLGDLVDENGNVVRSLDVQPWSEWSGAAGGFVGSVVTNLDVLLARIAAAQTALLILAATPLPDASGTPLPPGGTPAGTPGGSPPPVIIFKPDGGTGSSGTPGPSRGDIPGPSRGGVPGPTRQGYQFATNPVPAGGASGGSTVNFNRGAFDGMRVDSSERVDELVEKMAAKLPGKVLGGGSTATQWAKMARVLNRSTAGRAE